MKMKKIVIVLLIAIACVTQTNAAELSRDLIQAVEQAISYGDFRFDHANGRVYINANAYWYSIDAQKKEGVCIMLAKYMAYVRQEPQDWINVYDKHTGKKIGKWGAGGLKVY